MIPTAFSPYDNIFLQVSRVKMKIFRCYDRKTKLIRQNPVMRYRCSENSGAVITFRAWAIMHIIGMVTFLS